jgi:phenylpyruvate tautomerase PptA (4-oxalocrotonate tautomerase family)
MRCLSGPANKKTSAGFTKYFTDTFGVPADRIYISFQDIAPENWGSSGTTFGSVKPKAHLHHIPTRFFHSLFFEVGWSDRAVLSLGSLVSAKLLPVIGKHDVLASVKPSDTVVPRT